MGGRGCRRARRGRCARRRRRHRIAGPTRVRLRRGCGRRVRLVYLHAPLYARVDDLAVAPNDPTVLALGHSNAAKHVSMAALESMRAGLRFGAASECQPNPRREDYHQRRSPHMISLTPHRRAATRDRPTDGMSAERSHHGSSERHHLLRPIAGSLVRTTVSLQLSARGPCQQSPSQAPFTRTCRHRHDDTFT